MYYYCAFRAYRHILGRTSAVSYFHTTPAYWESKKVLQKFKLADIGEGITECEVIKWSVKAKARVQAFDPLCEVQSDKASVEITSPFDGVVQELLAQEGEIVKVGAGLCLIEVDEEVADEDSTNSTTTAVEPASPSVQAVQSADTSSSHCETESHPQLQQPETKQSVDPVLVFDSARPNTQNNVLAMPSVRHFAHQMGVDLAQLVPGSGKDGRVEKSDVETFLNNNATRSEERPTSARQTQVDADVIVELGRTRYGMWKSMTKSLEIPLFGYSTTLDLTAIHHLLPTLNAHIPIHFRPPPASPAPPASVSPSALYPVPLPPAASDFGHFTRLTYLPILLKTLSRAMHEWPLFRSSITPTPTPTSTPDPSTPAPKPTLTIRPHADISIALSTPTGLYTPTITHTDTYSIYALAARLTRLAHLGRQTPCALSPDDMPRRGGTLTLSNVGAIGKGDFAAPVLVPGGGVAIVAVGRARWVWDVERADDGVGERRLKVGVSWSADHRVVEGAELAAFVECWRGYVEAPERLIADSV